MDNMQNWQALAAAVIVRGVKDYKKLQAGKKPNKRGIPESIEGMQDWFRGEEFELWACMVSLQNPISGSYIVDNL